MAKRQRQQSLLSVWSGKRIRSEGNEDNYGSPASGIQNLSGEQQLDLHGMKAGGLQQSLEKFNSLFCLRLCHLLFSMAEQLSLTLQKKT